MDSFLTSAPDNSIHGYRPSWEGAKLPHLPYKGRLYSKYLRFPFTVFCGKEGAVFVVLKGSTT